MQVRVIITFNGAPLHSSVLPKEKKLSFVIKMTLTANVVRSAFVGIDTTAIVSGVLPVARGGSGVSNSTGTGNIVLSNAPTLSNVTISGNGLFVSNGSNTAPSLTFSSNTSAGLYLANNLVTSSTNIQTPSGISMDMNTSVPSGGHSVLIQPIACAWFLASQAGVLTSKSTPTYYKDSNNWRGWYGSVTQYNFVRTYVNLVSGTYTFRIVYVRNTDRGIITVKLNDAQITTIDTYSDSLTSGTSEVDSISVTLTGVQKLELQMNTKNANSTNYQFEWVSAAFIRTS